MPHHPDTRTARAPFKARAVARAPQGVPARSAVPRLIIPRNGEPNGTHHHIRHRQLDERRRERPARQDEGRGRREREPKKNVERRNDVLHCQLTNTTRRMTNHARNASPIVTIANWAASACCTIDAYAT